MWEFPSTQSFISSNGFILIWTIAISCISLAAWILFIRSIKNNTKDSSADFLKNLAAGAFTFFIAFFSWYSLISNYSQVSQCRNLDLKMVKAIRVTKMSGEDSIGSKAFLFNDSDKVREGLKILQNADSFDRQKERFVYGYRMQLIAEKDLFEPISLYYFSETQNSRKIDVIIPQCGNVSDGVKRTDNVYSSPEFGDWLRENVEPLLKEVR